MFKSSDRVAALRVPQHTHQHYRKDTAKIVWQDNNTVIINGHTLNVPENTYDFRND
ncbi:DUF5412 family protein [Bacillus sp. BP-3]|uniref:DUF5412 family protein n=1 Tax=Bacillus sp. BP-3 TaxID=3022773 RepID=UPI00232AAB4C|nr:DUF5412 family protein [Bacillus sp. BP-3]MDC2867920.1 DUF5412 family protein [Bacillus sp. BP-3]